MEQFEWQRKAMAKGDFVNMVEEYCLIWRNYGVDWNSIPDASEIEDIHLNRKQHQALASRLTMIPRAYMLRFCYNTDHKVQRNATRCRGMRSQSSTVDT